MHIPDSSVVELLEGEDLQLLQPNSSQPNMDAFIVTVAQKARPLRAYLYPRCCYSMGPATRRLGSRS